MASFEGKCDINITQARSQMNSLQLNKGHLCILQPELAVWQPLSSGSTDCTYFWVM